MKILSKILSLVLFLGLSFGALTLTASAAENTVYGIGFVTASSLRLRSGPSTDSPTIAQAPRNDCVVVLRKTGDWYQVNHNLKVGYMHADHLQVRTRENAELGYGRVTGSNVNLRSGPSTGYSSVGKVSQGAKCYIIGLNQGWYKVIYEGKTCYIRSDYLALTEFPYENQASPNSPKYFRLGKAISPLPSGGSNFSSPSTGSGGSAILTEAKKYLGTPYVYGGASPSGFDCSGFVYYVLRQCGYSPYRSPADQYRQGTAVSKANLKPGDIVFFANTYKSGISHVGIYAGNGQFIHSPNSRSTVSYSTLTSGYWSDHYYGARRMG